MSAVKDNLRGNRLLAFVVAVDSSCPDSFKEEMYQSCSAGVLAAAGDREGVYEFVAKVEIPPGMARALGASAGTAGLPVCGAMMEALTIRENESISLDGGCSGTTAMFLAGYQRMVLKEDRQAATDAIVAYVTETRNRWVVAEFLSPMPALEDMVLLEEKFAQSASQDRESVLEIIREKKSRVLRVDMEAALRASIFESEIEHGWTDE